MHASMSPTWHALSAKGLNRSPSSVGGNYTIQSSFVERSGVVGGGGKLKLTLGAMMGREEESIERPMVRAGTAGGSDD